MTCHFKTVLISFKRKALHKNTGKCPNFKGKINGLSLYLIEVYS